MPEYDNAKLIAESLHVLSLELRRIRIILEQRTPPLPPVSRPTSPLGPDGPLGPQ